MLKYFRVLFALIPGLLFSINIFAQNPEYTTQWKKADDLVKKGLTKSALEEVNKIFITAKKS